MKAIRAHGYGGPEVLKVDELPTPEPGRGQARVAVAWAGVNFIDVYHRTGLYKGALPVAMGLEGSGVVDAVGAEVSGLAVGTKVAWTGVPGSYATHVVAPADRLVRVPDGVGMAQAAAAMLQGMTAQYLTRTTYAVRHGDTMVVHAAAGGVGLLLCQLGRMAGARVVGTTSTEAKAEAARAAGADDVVRYDEVAEAALRATDGKGAQVVYDGVGAATWRRSIECLAVRGMMVFFGQSSGPVPPVDPLLLATRSLFMTRPALHHYTADAAELAERAGEVLGLVAAKRLEIKIGREVPIEEAAEAHRLLEGRETSGKVLLRVS